jgi:hypothetical protein
MGVQDLIQEGFGALNSYKRHRALREIKVNDRMFHDLQMFKMIDKIELTLRAINKETREGTDESSD